MSISEMVLPLINRQLDQLSVRRRTPALNGGGTLYELRSSTDNEGGAVLLLALIFVIVVTLSIFGLITFGGTGILNAANLQGQRSLEFAADGATTAAIQAVRYSNYQFNTTS